MPGGDRTGPMGMGPMTGRAAGYCAGSPVPGFLNAPGGQAFGGRGMGGRGMGGRGRRNWYYATGLTGWQRAAAAAQAFGGGQFVPPVQAGFGATPTTADQQELHVLKQQAQAMEQQMAQLRERIAQLETEDGAA
ncbi:MAG: DUF5320 domain-containing protein [Pirellulales bacterium]|nr:DUF5320 domain-containing protein [Pirellulales bacterium]